MSLLETRLLLDTGPTAQEVREIQRRFAALDLAVTAEGHSYGGPPPTSAFLIVLNAPVARLLDHFAAEIAEGPDRLRELVDFLRSLRADPRRWGRPHAVTIEDAANGITATLAAELPRAAYEGLLAVDVSAVGRGSSPVDLAWDPRLERWTATLTEAPMPVARRLPTRAGSGAGSAEPSVVGLGTAEIAGLWRVVHGVGDGVGVSDGIGVGVGDSAVRWQRAYVVLYSSMGWTTASIAARTMLSPERVRTVIRNFNRDGFAALETLYAGGDAPLRMTEAEHRDAAAAVRRGPHCFGLTDRSEWDAESLAQVLVGQGIVEDVDARWLEELTGIGSGLDREGTWEGASVGGTATTRKSTTSRPRTNTGSMAATQQGRAPSHRRAHPH
ncbi:helix-turn-helix domain-containing protein [Catenulispora sp. NL8]|uniref:Helix-turn-helix domain-containing protein n=1 Tax=Catenulispora pinistramenti TaxID=2705254 RepID=A0ABS5KM82_9ACTN|nr:helix-turn-helix domain-containing protein [Catenulispora pinistramenti]MBS2547155.1 helix-turn-helix domain-containing protein [Catenulispora pinistramenti]